MVDPSTALELRWGFLAPWCAHLQGQIRYVDVSDDRGVWAASRHRLYAVAPSQIDRENDKVAFSRFREALALLGAVAHVDVAALNVLLDKYCQATKENPEAVQLENTSFGFVMRASRLQPGNTLAKDLTLLCGTDQQRLQSDEYTAALGKIVAMDKTLKMGEPGVEIEIPVRINFAAGEDGDRVKELSELAAVEKAVTEMWRDWYARHLEKRAVRSGQLRAKFVVEPMIADVANAPMESEAIQTVERVLQQNVWFSRLSLYPPGRLQISADETNAASMFGKLMRRVFDSTRQSLDLANANYRLRADQASVLRQFGKLTVKMQDETLDCEAFNALCSALVLTQTTTDLTLLLEMDPYDSDQSVHWWRWLAYALFSRRARSCSVITHLTLDSIGHLSMEDAEEFTAMLSSDHPEEKLACIPRGAVDERDATLRGGAPIIWDFDERGRPFPTAEPLTFESPIKFVRTFSDDGQSEWVNVLVPGCGECQVKRSDLTFDCDSSAGALGGEITALSVRFNTLTKEADGLPCFMAAVGSSLTSLSLYGPRDLLGDDLFCGYCPNLLDLTIHGSIIDAQLDFRQFRMVNSELPSIICNWHDVAPLSTTLSDADSPLTRCLYRLRVCLANRFRTGTIPHGYDPGNYESGLDALLEMLEVNNSLEYLEVIIPAKQQAYISKFEEFHEKPIERARALPLETKLAFLSVVERRKSLRPTKERKCDASASVSALCKLDHLMLSNIFAFTAPPVLRQVICRSVCDWVALDWRSSDGEESAADEGSPSDGEESDANEGSPSDEDEQSDEDDEGDGDA